MKINQNNDITVYRGETTAIDFKLSQRSDYYVPFLVSRARINPMICITIGSTRRESKNIVSKQIWLDWTSLGLPRFVQTVVEDLGDITFATPNDLASVKNALSLLISHDIMYQYRMQNEIDAKTPKLHFAYITTNNEILIDDYNFTVTMPLDETITLDMINTDYFYQIELMDTVPMLSHIQMVLDDNGLLSRMPLGFTNNDAGITEYLPECIAAINSALPNHWGHRINDPLTCPVASVSNIQMLQAPRHFTVISVIV